MLLEIYAEDPKVIESSKPQTKLYKLSKTKDVRCSLKKRIFLKKKELLEKKLYECT